MIVHESDTARVTRLAVGDYDNNAYVVACLTSNQAVIVDAAAETGRILEACSGFDVLAIYTTHGHWDHLQVLDEVKTKLDVPWYLHPEDIQIAGRAPDEVLADGDELVVGDLALHVRHTPGHTPGSVSFVMEPVVFSGDTLFPGGPGATRWEYSSFGQIMDSLEQRLFDLPDTTLVLPGHGATTTIGEERPEVPAWRRRGW